MAGGAGRLAHKGLQFLPHPTAFGLPVAAGEVVENALKLVHIHAGAVFTGAHHLDPLSPAAVHQHVHRLVGQFLKGHVQRKAVVGGQAVVIHPGDGGAGAVIPTGSADGPLPNGEGGIPHHQAGIHRQIHAKAGAVGTGAKGVVEGEHTGSQLLHAGAVLRAGVVEGEGQLLPPHHIHGEQTVGEGGGGLNGVGQPPPQIRADD